MARRVDRHEPGAQARRRGRTRARRRDEPGIQPERVLRALQGRARPALAIPALLRALELSPGSRNALRRSLQELVAQGRLDRLGARYRLRRSDGFVEGVFTPARKDGAGRVQEDSGRVWQVTQTGDAGAGDRVLLQPLGAERHGEIVGVLEGRRDAWVGVLERRGRIHFVTPWRDTAAAVVSIGLRELLRRAARRPGPDGAARARARSRDRAVADPAAKRGSPRAASSRCWARPARPRPTTGRWCGGAVCRTSSRTPCSSRSRGPCRACARRISPAASICAKSPS